MYKYFVSYFASSGPNLGWCFGDAIIGKTKKIKNFEDINIIREMISQENSKKDVPNKITILNYKLMK